MPNQPSRCPLRECDIILKGGITSGIVYPPAIWELAAGHTKSGCDGYIFRSIGGASAGAIAAALTAAAEYKRATSSGGNDLSGFQQLVSIPDELKVKGSTRESTKLLELFQPSPKLKRSFTVMRAWISTPHSESKYVNVAFALIGHYWLSVIAFFWIGVLAILLYRSVFDSLPSGIGWVVSTALWFCVTGIFVLWRFYREMGKHLPRNGYGFCDGFSTTISGATPLTKWLHEKIQTTAGRTVNDPPLTLGDLWSAGQSEPSGERRIDLVTMTSNLSHGHPQRVPFESADFFFNPAEMRGLLPKEVVDAMIQASDTGWIARRNAIIEGLYGRRLGTNAPPRKPQGKRAYNGESDEDTLLVPLPYEKLPVLLAARISLSFPLLISAVPLYSVDYAKEDNLRRLFRNETVIAERCWFSDGGIGANFPIHLFDHILPRRPTFGINLGERPLAAAPASYEQVKREARGTATGGTSFGEQAKPDVYLPSISSFPAPVWRRWEHDHSNAGSFLVALLDMARNWTDNSLMSMHGCRERIVHLGLAHDEGGLNLNMSARLIEQMVTRGSLAGKALRDDFDFDAHRWVRLRVSMGILQDVLERLRLVYPENGSNEGSYRQLLSDVRGIINHATTAGATAAPLENNSAPSWPFSYRSQEEMELAQTAMDELVKAIQALTKLADAASIHDQAPDAADRVVGPASLNCFSCEMQPPSQELRARPRL